MMSLESIKKIAVLGYNPLNPVKPINFGRFAYVRVQDSNDNFFDFALQFNKSSVQVQKNASSDVSDQDFNAFNTAEVKELLIKLGYTMQEVVHGDSWHMNYNAQFYESEVERIINGDLKPLSYYLRNAIEAPSFVIYHVTFKATSTTTGHEVVERYQIYSDYNFMYNPDAILHVYQMLNPLMNLQYHLDNESHTILINPLLRTVVKIEDIAFEKFTEEDFKTDQIKRASYRHSLISPLAELKKH